MQLHSFLINLSAVFGIFDGLGGYKSTTVDFFSCVLKDFVVASRDACGVCTGHGSTAGSGATESLSGSLRQREGRSHSATQLIQPGLSA